MPISYLKNLCIIYFYFLKSVRTTYYQGKVTGLQKHFSQDRLARLPSLGVLSVGMRLEQQWAQSMLRGKDLQ